MRILGWQQSLADSLLMNPSPERIMSTAAVSGSSIYQELQTFYQTRKTDLQQLGQALQSGDLAGAQTAYNALVTLGQSGPFSNSDPFRNTQREQDFTAIGTALQSGDLAGAQQAFTTLENTFRKQQPVLTSPPPNLAPSPVETPIIINIGNPGTSVPSGYTNPIATPTAFTTGPATTTTAPSSDASVLPADSSSVGATTGTASSTPPEIILNLGTNSTGNAAPEEITITLGNNPNGPGEQLTVGVNNGQGGQGEQIAINFNNSANEQIILNLFNTSAGGQSQGNSVSLQA